MSGEGSSDRGGTEGEQWNSHGSSVLSSVRGSSHYFRTAKEEKVRSTVFMPTQGPACSGTCVFSVEAELGAKRRSLQRFKYVTRRVPAAMQGCSSSCSVLAAARVQPAAVPRQRGKQEQLKKWRANEKGKARLHWEGCGALRLEASPLTGGGRSVIPTRRATPELPRRTGREPFPRTPARQ